MLGVTRLEPDDSRYDTHHRAALSLGGGYQFFLSEQLRLRLDLRGVYTALNSGGSVFCSGGVSSSSAAADTCKWKPVLAWWCVFSAHSGHHLPPFR